MDTIINDLSYLNLSELKKVKEEIERLIAIGEEKARLVKLLQSAK